jgi:hypothetical protein
MACTAKPKLDLQASLVGYLLQADTPHKEAVVPIIRPERFAKPEALATHVKAVMLTYPLTNAILLPGLGDINIGQAAVHSHLALMFAFL